jgi:hypothetical protein
VFRLRRHDHITDSLAILHWLRIQERVDFKLAVMAYKSLHGQSPPYLDVLHRIADQPRARQLCSSISDRVEVPRYRLTTVGRRSFPIAASFIWNSLPQSVQLAPSLTVFRNQLKTFLFRRSFPDIII